MKKNLLYIGNKLAHKGASPTSIDILAPLLKKEGFNLCTASSIQNRIFRMLDMIATVIRYRNTTDYVLIDTYSTANFWYAVIIGKLCQHLNMEYIPILRGGKLPERLLKSPKNSKKLFKNAFLNVAPSSYLSSCFLERGFKNVRLIPNSIPLKQYRFKERLPLKPKLLWVRAFAEIYNPLLAIQILEQLVKIYPEASLCMVGADKDGSLEKCKRYAEKHQLPVEFTGKLAKKDWVHRATAFDIFINTTHYDNTPVSVIEAMALGLPVVTTNVGGIPYLLLHEKEALLLDDNDCQGFVRAIESLMKNPEKASKMAQNARKKAEKFDWETVKSEWKKILR